MHFINNVWQYLQIAFEQGNIIEVVAIISISGIILNILGFIVRKCLLFLGIFTPTGVK